MQATLLMLLGLYALILQLLKKDYHSILLEDSVLNMYTGSIMSKPKVLWWWLLSLGNHWESLQPACDHLRWAPLPAAVPVPCLRVLFTAIEAMLTFFFWSLQSTTEYEYGMKEMCSWLLEPYVLVNYFDLIVFSFTCWWPGFINWCDCLFISASTFQAYHSSMLWSIKLNMGKMLWSHLSDQSCWLNHGNSISEPHH